MASRGKVLISGASIAGPVCAYWLCRAGFEVTLAERSGAPRGGGYAIDIRGPAVTVLENMGLLEQIRGQNIHMRDLTFVDRHGKTIAEFRMDDLMGAEEGANLEVPRGALTSQVFEATKKAGANYRFNENIVGVSQDANGVDVEFASGATERFDIVIAAEGLHSSTRRLVFGPEEPLIRHMGYFFGIFSMPNLWGFEGKLRVFSDVGRACALYAVRPNEDVHAMLTVALPESPHDLMGDAERQKSFLAGWFTDAGGEVPQILDGLQKADDLFCDVVSQMHVPKWSNGRVALIGDAAAAPSFMTGQGTSLAIVEAYMLAQALAEHADYQEAFTAYEQRCRPFVQRNQALARPGGWGLIPRTPRAAVMRRVAFRLMPLLRWLRDPGKLKREVHTSLTLPGFPESN